MGLAASDTLAEQLLEHLFRTASFAKPTNITVALMTGVATDSQLVGEVSGNGYLRQSLPPLDANWTAVASGSLKSDQKVTFPAATAQWGTIRSAALIFNDGTDTQYLFGNLTTPQFVDNANVFEFDVGKIIVRLD